MNISYSETLGDESEAVAPFLMFSRDCVVYAYMCFAKKISCGDFSMLGSNSGTKLYIQLSWQVCY